MKQTRLLFAVAIVLSLVIALRMRGSGSAEGDD